MTDSTKPSSPENGKMLTHLLFTIIIPSLILAKLSADDRLGAETAFVVALAFPLFWGLRDIIGGRKINYFAIIGLLNVGFTGGLGLLKADGLWFAVKEAAFPLIIGIGVAASLWTKSPVVKTLFLNDTLFDLKKIETRLEQLDRTREMDRLVRRVTWLFAFSFLLSAALNFGLARFLLKSPTGTPEFNAELGRMTALSLPVIALPVLLFLFGVLWYLFTQLSTLTEIPKNDLLKKN
jgi:hypothetical protein